MRIAYQGEPGAFSEAAARRISPDAPLVACRTFEEVFASVEADSLMVAMRRFSLCATETGLTAVPPQYLFALTARCR